MDIAIIGTGNVGRALATSLTRAGHSVTLASRDPEHARQLAVEVGGAAATSSAQAARDAQVVVVAVPFVGSAEQVAAEIRHVVAGKAVIDVTNPLRTDFSGLAVEGTSAAEELQRWLPEASVVKAFNTILASNQAAPGRAPRPSSHPTTGGAAAGSGPGCLHGLQPARRRPPEGRSDPGGHGLPQHQPQCGQRMGLDLWLEAGAVDRWPSPG